jgi:hypothetical protein
VAREEIDPSSAATPHPSNGTGAAEVDFRNDGLGVPVRDRVGDRHRLSGSTGSFQIDILQGEAAGP